METSQDSFALPHWKDIESKIMCREELNPLERFMFENTPALPVYEQEFRDELLAAIRYVIQQNGSEK